MWAIDVGPMWLTPGVVNKRELPYGGAPFVLYIPSLMNGDVAKENTYIYIFAHYEHPYISPYTYMIVTWNSQKSHCHPSSGTPRRASESLQAVPPI